LQRTLTETGALGKLIRINLEKEDSASPFFADCDKVFGKICSGRFSRNFSSAMPKKCLCLSCTFGLGDAESVDNRPPQDISGYSALFCKKNNL
jgi:hypothetical protein